MAIISESELIRNGIDIDAIKVAIGPKKVQNRKDGTVEIENHSLQELIQLMRYLRGIQRSKSDRTALISFSKVRPGDSTGGYERRS